MGSFCCCEREKADRLLDEGLTKIKESKFYLISVQTITSISRRLRIRMRNRSKVQSTILLVSSRRNRKRSNVLEKALTHSIDVDSTKDNSI